MTIIDKKIQVKWYDRDLNFLKLEGNLKNVPTWKAEINRGLLDTNVDLNYPFDHLPDYIQANNIVRMWEISKDNPTGIEIYRGVIGQIKPYLKSGDNGVSVEILGLSSLLQDTYSLDGTNLTVVYTATDIADVFKSIIDNWQLRTGSTLISYTGTSIATTGIDIDLTIDDKKHLEALNEVFKFADSDWYWYIDVDGVVYLDQYPTTADYTFTIGKDLEISEAPMDYKNIINQQTVFYASGNVTVNSASSIALYGLKEGKVIRDTNIGGLGTATARATQIVAGNNTPKVRGSIRVTSQNVNLPDIRIGNTCKVRNYNEVGSILDEILPIVGYTYSLNEINLEIGEIRSSFARELQSFFQSIQ